MAEARTWTCPACNRRVPMSLAICRCGASRAEADFEQAVRQVATAGPRVKLRNEPLPKEIKVWLVVTALALAGALVYAWRARGPDPLPPLLGWVDEAPPSPSPYKRPSRR